ncbi:MAG: MBL fold metallo-hydrolase [bacterium]|nr:MBL fold metallo-hydrolase [bacterium]
MCYNHTAYIKFLGTAGTRFVVSKQIRASGGIWLFLNGIHVHLDPGPGALVKSVQSNLNPQDLSAIILSHRHLDHSNDANIMIEAMTNGGTNRKGTLFCPQDALDNDPIIFEYIQDYVGNIEILREGTRYRIGETAPLLLEFDIPVRNIHGNVQAYGMRFFPSERTKSTIGYIGDTRFFEGLINDYQGVKLLIVNAVIENQMPGVDHLCVEDVIRLIKGVSPKLAILTHFGLSMINAQPEVMAEKIAQSTGIDTVASVDGMVVGIGERFAVSR